MDVPRREFVLKFGRHDDAGRVYDADVFMNWIPVAQINREVSTLLSTWPESESGPPTLDLAGYYPFCNDWNREFVLILHNHLDVRWGFNAEMAQDHKAMIHVNSKSHLFVAHPDAPVRHQYQHLIDVCCVLCFMGMGLMLTPRNGIYTITAAEYLPPIQLQVHYTAMSVFQFPTEDASAKFIELCEAFHKRHLAVFGMWSLLQRCSEIMYPANSFVILINPVNDFQVLLRDPLRNTIVHMGQDQSPIDHDELVELTKRYCNMTLEEKCSVLMEVSNFITSNKRPFLVTHISEIFTKRMCTMALNFGGCEYPIVHAQTLSLVYQHA